MNGVEAKEAAESLLLARRVIGRIGSAAAAGLGAVLFGVGMAWFRVALGLQPNMTAAIAGIMVLGIAVRLAFPTLMDAGTTALPASSYATGSECSIGFGKRRWRWVWPLQ